jgi:hypothetical protein
MITNNLNAAINYALDGNSTIFKGGSPMDYRLTQVADLICGIELANLKFEVSEQTATDITFFSDKGYFKKSYPKKMRRKLL